MELGQKEHAPGLHKSLTESISFLRRWGRSRASRFKALGVQILGLEGFRA